LGSSEKIQKREILRFPSKDARIFAIVHLRHVEYYHDPNQTQITPFIIPPNPDQDIRNTVKAYFLYHYNLHVSVRPPHKKIFFHDAPILYVYVQIQVGKHSFPQCQKSDLESFIAP
jgi:hypothetical protein